MDDQRIAATPPQPHDSPVSPADAARLQPGTPGGHGNHGVKFEQTDADTSSVVWFGVITILMCAFTAVGGYFAYFALLEHLKPEKASPLPPAKVSDTQLPPEPRLEALEDLGRPNDQRYDYLPRRADEVYAEQRLLLKDGGKGQLPIATAVKDVIGKLPGRKDAKGEPVPAPATFLRQMPGNANSGRGKSEGP